VVLGIQRGNQQLRNVIRVGASHGGAKDRVAVVDAVGVAAQSKRDVVRKKKNCQNNLRRGNDVCCWKEGLGSWWGITARGLEGGEL